MPVMQRPVDSGAAQYSQNQAFFAEQLANLAQQYEIVTRGGATADDDKAERSLARLRSRGKLLPRERISYLLDPMSPFLELSPLAGWGTDDPLGAGVVTGIGVIAGVECVISANDPTVKGGSQSPSAVRKGLRALDIAAENHLPFLSLTESGGADLPKQAQIFVPGGATFKKLSQLSAAGIPTISLVFGSSTAGGAYLPAMSDYTVLQQDSARVYLGGPPLVKMAIDEDADEEELGGAEMHGRQSGLADYVAATEEETLLIGRQIVGRLASTLPAKLEPERAERPPKYDQAELLGIASADVRVPFDVRDVFARVLDGSEFEEFKPNYGTTLVAGWGHLGGYQVGVLANNGILFGQESQKGAHFIQLCNRMNVPIIFGQNITGFMVGTQYEQGGIIKDGAKLINAVSNSSVPHLTLMMGASYGAGNYGMSGRAYDPRFVFTWPNHKIAVMGARQLAGVLSIVAEQKSAAAGVPFDEEAFAPIRDAFAAQVESESTAEYATGQLWDDGIIDPRDTRQALILGLRASARRAPADNNYGVWRM